MLKNNNYNFADKIADLCYKHYSSIGKSGKPVKDKEWTLLSSIVKLNKNDNNLSIISLATGSKCIGSNSMSPDGIIINDSHAEVLARRCFLRYLYYHINLVKNGSSSDVLQLVKSNKINDSNDDDDDSIINEHYEIKSDITFHLFTSQVPCGDASVIPKISNNLSDSSKCNNYVDNDEDQSNACNKFNNFGESSDKKRKFINHDNIDSDNKKIKVNEILQDSSFKIINTPCYLSDSIGPVIVSDFNDIYRTGAKCIPNDPRQDTKGFGIDYQVTGAVRTKPGRGDPTLSVSCSDKIARWNAVGLQGALLSLLIKKPIYLSSIIIGGGGPYSEECLYRAVIERTKTDQRPDLLCSNLIFEMSKYSPENTSADRPSPAALMWTNIPERPIEVAVKGIRQGTTKKSKDKGSLRICKRELFKLFITLTDDLFINNSYKEVKLLSKDYQNNWSLVKQNLGAWTVKPDYLEFIVNKEEF
ncbi:tRNA-specific adenosine deaminase 1-like isoform X1 [Lycorma delicatula]|uniref:tRNA-specific adenosine deaminase 1-like isoform X1 n=1 Tax=Lycorma delicatula TaxID=130591 RepID=UPI003F51A72F